MNLTVKNNCIRNRKSKIRQIALYLLKNRATAISAPAGAGEEEEASIMVLVVLESEFRFLRLSTLPYSSEVDIFISKGQAKGSDAIVMLTFQSGAGRRVASEVRQSGFEDCLS